MTEEKKKQLKTRGNFIFLIQKIITIPLIIFLIWIMIRGPKEPSYSIIAGIGGIMFLIKIFLEAAYPSLFKEKN